MNEKQENEENRSFSNNDKVGKAVKQNSVGEYFISTVRLPNAYMFDGKWSFGKYETMIFLKGNAEYMKRCDTLAQAKIQHKEVKRCVEKYNFDNQYNHYRLVLRGHENDVLIKKEDWNNLLSYLQESKALRSRHSKYTK